MTEKERVVLNALLLRAQTVDQFVSRNEFYVNSWAPTFTYLRSKGLIARTGEKAETRHGSWAHVLTITSEGLVALEEEEGYAA